jgi:hypothetical protein
MMDKVFRTICDVLIGRALEVVCVVNLVSVAYLNLLPNDPLNLSPIHNYLLAVNAYGFGTVLFKCLVQPRHNQADGNVFGDSQNKRNERRHVTTFYRRAKRDSAGSTIDEITVKQ